MNWSNMYAQRETTIERGFGGLNESYGVQVGIRLFSPNQPNPRSIFYRLPHPPHKGELPWQNHQPGVTKN